MGEGCKELWKENKASFITVEIRRWLWQPAVIYVIVNSLRLFLARLVFLGSKQSRRTTLNNESCDKEASVQRGTRRILAYKKRRKALKRYPKKEKRRCFRKRVSAKTAVFSVFKSIKSVDKSNDTLTARRRRALV